MPTVKEDDEDQADDDPVEGTSSDDAPSEAPGTRKAGIRIDPSWINGG